MARFFVPRENIRRERGFVSGQELEHLRKVLRLRLGDRVTIFDDEGWEYQGTIRSLTARAGEIEILESHKAERDSSIEIILAQALSKGEKMDWVVEKATELGVQTMIPFVSARTVPRLEAKKMELRRERWKKIALSATKQSGRARIPEICDLCDFGELVRRPWSCDLKLLFWEKESQQGLSQIREEKKRLESLLLIIGPEGGFSFEEASEAVAYGFKMIGLGKRILRTETAALAALSIVQFLWGDMG